MPTMRTPTKTKGFSMRNNYANAKKILPPSLMEKIQEYFSGLLWVPGIKTTAERRLKIIEMRQQGFSVQDIGDTLGLSGRRIRQILAETK